MAERKDLSLERINVLGTAWFEYQGRGLDFESAFARRRMLDLVHEKLEFPESVELRWGAKGEAAAETAEAAEEAATEDEAAETESADPVPADQPIPDGERS